jgi:amino acid adenylation domain-containing protein
MPDSSLSVRRSLLSPEQQTMLERRIKGHVADQLAARGIVRRIDSTTAPLSLAQEGVWLQEQLASDSSAYNIFGALRLRGQLNIPALEASLSEVVRRHDILRTSFRIVDGKPMQFVAPPRTLHVEIEEFSHLDTREQAKQVKLWAIEQASRPFDLENEQPFRVHLLRFRADAYGMLLTVHHIAADGWSFGLLFSEILSLYSIIADKRPSRLPELSCQYGDYAAWQREKFREKDQEEHLAYWRAKLSGAPLLLDLPSDRPRPPVRTLAGDRLPFEMPRELTERVRTYIKHNHITLFTLAFAACAILLHRYTGNETILIGSPVSNRSRPELEGVVGLFLNTLVFRADFRGDPSISDFMANARAEVFETFNHRELPFERIVSGLRVPRESSHSPIFQVALTFLPQRSIPAVSGIAVDHIVGSYGSSRLDLTIYFGDAANGDISGRLAYATDIFDRETVQSFAENLKTVIGNIVTAANCRISELSVLAPEVLRMRALGRNAVGPDIAFELFERSTLNLPITARFAEQVRRAPEALAVCDGAMSWSYAELDQRANAIASAVVSGVAGTSRYVALLFDHDAMMIAAMLGVLKAGKAYVPLDPLHPAERLQSIIEDVQPGAVLAGRNCVELAAACVGPGVAVIDAEGQPPARCQSPPCRHPESETYVLYTSGSTGRPKGVVQNDRNVLHFISVYSNALHIHPGDRLTLFASYGFDASVMDIYGALLNGASLHLRSFQREGFPGLGEWLHSQAITVWHSTPTAFRQAAQHLYDGEAASVRVVVLGGEEAVAADLSLVRQHFGQNCLLVNGYGPTESTVALQHFSATTSSIRGVRLPLGYAVNETRVLVLDRSGTEADLTGEIAISSAFLAQGYLGAPALTAERFVPSPLGEGGRLYRTGDIGRWRRDGTLEYLGRVDHQIKLRGYRIELGEIEAALCSHATVSHAVVVAHGSSPDDTRLTAYVVSTTVDMDESALRRHLSRWVPAYMIPSAFIRMDELPLTANGKIDRNRLPTPRHQTGVTEFTAPRTAFEELLVGIWRKVLNREEVGVENNFFDLGGHSLLLHRVHSEISGVIGQKIPITSLFQYPTIRAFAGYLLGERDGATLVSGRARGNKRKRLPARPRLHRSKMTG